MPDVSFNGLVARYKSDPILLYTANTTSFPGNNRMIKEVDLYV